MWSGICLTMRSVRGLGFRVLGLGFRVCDLAFVLQSLGFRV